MKLLFLDVDGVLNYAGWAEKHGLVPASDATIEQLVAWIDPEKVALVNGIVMRTGCHVILSSSTRSDPRMGVVLARAGLCVPIYDVTPILLWEVNQAGNIVDMKTRADEVYQVLRKYPLTSTFCVLDDQEHEWGRLSRQIFVRRHPHLEAFAPCQGQPAWEPESEDERVFRSLWLVKTDFATGILPEHVEHAVSTLNRFDWATAVLRCVHCGKRKSEHAVEEAFNSEPWAALPREFRCSPPARNEDGR